MTFFTDFTVGREVDGFSYDVVRAMMDLRTMRETRPPRTEVEREQVLSELENILKDPHFAHSRRYPAFLRYVVEQTLEGNAGQIKERTIGIDVFGRRGDYDTTNDTVVRYTAGEVRKRLAMYHHTHENAAIQISIPQGSYVPEFLHRVEEEEAEELSASIAVSTTVVETMPRTVQGRELGLGPAPFRKMSGLSAKSWNVVLVLLLVVLGGFAAELWWHTRGVPPSAVDRFWDPVLRAKGVPLLISGGVVFSPNLYSGVRTADRDTEYPFVSMQTAAALARVSGLLQRRGGNFEVQPANTSTLNLLRERPVILIGAYDNTWTMRLLQDVRFRLSASETPSIVDAANAGRVWARDHGLPYSSADDFAVVGRFKNPMTGGLVVVVAGLGRNGTEAAAQFLTDPHYMEMLEARLGHPMDEQNLEAVLKINVVDGRTGAPTLLDVTSW